MEKEITNEKQALAAVKKNGYAIVKLPAEFITAEICKAAVENDSYAFEFVPITFKTPELCRIAVMSYGYRLKHVPDKLKTPDLCEAAVKNYSDALEFVPAALKTRELCETAVKKHSSALEFVPDTHKTQELCETAVKQWAAAFKFVPDAHKTPELCIRAINEWPHALEFVPKALKTTELCAAALKKSANVLSFVPDDILNSPKFWLAVVSANYKLLDNVPENLLTEEIKLIAKNKKNSIAARHKALKGIKTSENLLKTLENLNLEKHKNFIAKTVRPAVEIIKLKNAGQGLACSRFGGLPDLPAGTKWPEFNSIPYRFLGQINFADIPAAETGLPSIGLLSIFVSDKKDDEPPIFYREDGFVHAIYIPELSNLETLNPPPNFGIENPCEIVLKFQPTVDIPFDNDQVKDWPFNDEEENEIYDEIRASLHKKDEYLLGYPAHNTLAYDPIPNPGWISLLNLFSDRKLKWQWADGDNLMIFIEKEKLEISDFSNLKADAG